MGTSMVLEKSRNPSLKGKILWVLGILIVTFVLTLVVLSILFENTRNTGLIEYSLEDTVHINSWISILEFDDNGQAWIGTKEDGISIFNGETWQTYSTKNSEILCDEIREIAFDNLGNAWIGTAAGVSVYDGETWSSYTTENSGISGNYILDIKFDNLGNVWIGTTEGLSVYYKDSWISYTTENSEISGNFIGDLEFDDLGNVWIDTSSPGGHGISVFDGETWLTLTKDNSGLPHGDVRGIEIDNLGHIWIQTAWQLYVFDGETWESHGFKYPFAYPQEVDDHDTIVFLEIDSSGRVMVLTYGVLRIYDGNIWTIYNSENSGVNNSDYFAVDPKGRIWFYAVHTISVLPVDAAGLPQTISPGKEFLSRYISSGWSNLSTPLIILALLSAWVAIYLENFYILFASAAAAFSLLVFPPFEFGRGFIVFTLPGGLLGSLIGGKIKKRKAIDDNLPIAIGFIIGALLGFGVLYLFALVSYAG